jgi:hypothetical protein
MFTPAPTPAPRLTTPSALPRLILAMCLLPLSACVAIGELAYDTRLEQERERCQSLLPSSERGACLERVRSTERQAQQVRQQNEDRDRGQEKKRPGDICITRSNGERVCSN